MLMTSLRKLLLVWMIAWLPLSGAIAAVMPISGMRGAASSNPAEMTEQAESAHTLSPAAQALLPCHTAAADSDTDQTGNCGHCLLCDLAVALMLPCIQDVQGYTPSLSFALAVSSAHTSFFPEPASPPPRTLVS